MIADIHIMDFVKLGSVIAVLAVTILLLARTS